jgi:transposase
VGGDWRDDLIAEQAAMIAEQRVVIAKLTARVAELEERLRKSSRNSSKPPSSDGPATPERPKQPPTGRKPGGQPGHQRNTRELAPVEQARKVVECIPGTCKVCRCRLHGRDPAPMRHQLWDLPVVKAFFDEYRRHALRCDRCGETTRGELPAGVPSAPFGTGVVATVVMLMGVYRLSKRMVPEIMQDLFGLALSTGSVIDCQRRMSEALAAPVEQARSHVRQQAVKHADETGWREGPRRARAWLWAAVTASVVVFGVHARRNADAARALLDTAVGVLVTDRHGAYNWWPARLRQLCWAHIKRDVTAIAERGHESERIARAMLEEIERMFAWWHRVRDGTLARSSFRVYMGTVRRRFEALLAEGAALPHAKTSETCKKLLKSAESLWTFVRVEGV